MGMSLILIEILLLVRLNPRQSVPTSIILYLISYVRYYKALCTIQPKRGQVPDRYIL